jgi:Tfp pilus assembly protein PilF
MRSNIAWLSIAIAVAAAPLPALAETIEELSLLADRATGEQTGIRLAQEQADRGDLLDALSTLERVLASNPRSTHAQLLHAVYLCRIDDRFGGQVEISKFDKKAFAKQDLATARTECGMQGKR